MIGLLDASARLEWWAAFQQQLRELGYVEGRDVAFEKRYAREDVERLRAMARELVRLNVSAIVTAGTVAAVAAKRATSAIPIVMATGADQVSLGLVDSLARPGGNVTGVSSYASQLTDKRFELLREIVPGLSRLAVLWKSDNIISANFVRDLERLTTESGVALQNLRVNTRDDVVGAFVAAARERAEAVYVVSAATLFAERRTISDLALKHRLPTMTAESEYVDAGLLASYGANYPDLFKRAAFYVDKILKGAKPGDLPMELPTKFDLVINLKTAKALGLGIPQPVLLLADRVIE
jgi:ABC-type uncharacterized transport system substrate-binding protein